MKNTLLILSVFILIAANGNAQENDDSYMNSSQRMLEMDERLTIGGYAQIDYNQPLENGVSRTGNLDVHRLVLLFGYKFNERTSFITEIEMEHVKELYVEQAFVNYRIKPWLNLRSGLMLIPMGIVNEYHEPPTYNGVERPNVDKYIVPTTWRELGAGFTGQFATAGIGYQLYVVNGFLGSDEGANKLSGSSLFRSGRQKGAESVLSSPNLALRVNYNGIPGLTAGLSGYFGKSQSTSVNGVDTSNPSLVASADSSIVGINMVGFDARYTIGGLGLRGQLTTGSISNTDQYNEFHGSDLGSGFMGYYAEISYDILHSMDGSDDQITPFVRYENYDTHRSVDASISRDLSYNRTDITFGLGWKPDPGVVFKADYQLFTNEGSTGNKGQFNAGVGIWF